MRINYFTFLVLCLITICSPLTLRSGEPEVNEILMRTLDTLQKVHTARYLMAESTYQSPTDSMCSNIWTYRMIECENPNDTSENAKFLRLLPEGKLERAYDGNCCYYGRFGYIEKSDLSKHYGVRYISPPFFNHATNLCKYLLTPNDKIIIKVEDEKDQWLIKAEVSEWQQVCFFGKPYICPSMPYTKSYFGLRVNKSTMMPSWLSFLCDWPQYRYERSVSDAEINFISADSFSVNDYLPDLPVYNENEASKVYRELMENHYKLVESSPLPTDTLQVCDGGTMSLVDLKDKVKVLVFSSEFCGVCQYVYPVINGIYDDYPTDSVAIFGIMWDKNLRLDAIKSYAKKHEIRFPMAHDNGHFYAHFMPTGLAPMVMVIDRNGEIILWEKGFDRFKAEKTEKKFRDAIDKALGRID